MTEVDFSKIKDPGAVEIIKLLFREVEKLRAENIKLREKIAYLEKNSSNSSKPPSSDITKPENEQRQPGIRKIGGQSRHQGSYRKEYTVEEIDRIENIPNLESCPVCRGILQPTGELKKTQVVELKESPLEVIEYVREGCLCTRCNKAHYAKLPINIVEGDPYGLRLQSTLGYLKGNTGASYSELSEFCEEVFQLSMSRAAICNIIKRTTGWLEKPYNQLSNAISKAESLNIDESGWKNNGQRMWVWVFCNKMLAYFSVQSSRGSKVLKQILGDTFSGNITSDFYSAYVCFANTKQQFCLAHLIRDIKFITTLPEIEARLFGEHLLRLFKILFQHWHARDDITPEQFLKKTDRLKRRIFRFLNDSEIQSREVRNIKKRILKHWNSIFRFTKEPEKYEPTNNLAEQTIRHIVKIRKQTQGSRSSWGQLWCAVSASALATCKKQNRSAFQFFLQAAIAKNTDSNYPSLLPT